jgi:putative drug exporter of the RND superfamily
MGGGLPVVVDLEVHVRIVVGHSHRDPSPPGVTGNVPASVVNKLISTAQSADRPLLNVQLGGDGIESVVTPNADYTSALLGVVLALIVLFFAFRRSVYGAILPLISALVAIGVGTSVVNVLTHAVSIANWVPTVAVIVALGVGVDYALFVVSRYRNGLLAGQSPQDAAVTALNTSGRAVLLAGLTVCAALLGLLVLPDPTLRGVAVTISLVVVLTMVASLTLLPAMLGFLGLKVLRRAERNGLAQDGRQVEQTGAFWLRWAEGLGRRPLIPAILALAVIVILALPVLSFRTAIQDSSTDPASSTTRAGAVSGWQHGAARDRYPAVYQSTSLEGCDYVGCDLH